MPATCIEDCLFHGTKLHYTYSLHPNMQAVRREVKHVWLLYVDHIEARLHAGMSDNKLE